MSAYTSTEDTDLLARAELLYRQRFAANCKRIDRWFAYLMVAQWVFAIIVALVISPYGWEGKQRALHTHVYLAIFLGGIISSLPIFLAFARPGWIGTRITIAIAQMLWSGLLIHLAGGRVETHFHVFGSLAFLAFYRDPIVLLPATVVISADHLVRQLFWPESVYGATSVEWWRFVEHTGWVAFEEVFLLMWCFAGRAEMREMSRQQVAVEFHERAAATRIQTAVLPSSIELRGLEGAARMHTADQVGGDFYDIYNADDGGWIAIGDVAGHGVTAGLTMLHAQSALSALVRHDCGARPSAIWHGLNRTYIDNIRGRLGNDDHMTLSLFRYYDDGRFELTGAHEEALIWRARSQLVEAIPIRGTWIGLKASSWNEEQSFQLEVGDLLVLYTDGIIEAKDATGARVGVDAVRAVIAAHHAEPVANLRDAIFELARYDHSDDASVMVFRYVGVPAAAAAA